MSRVQLALTVSDIDASVAYYERLFATPAAKRRPGYANFAIADPPLKLVLIEGAAGTSGGTLNHLGIEVETPGEVTLAATRLADEGLAERTEEGVDCCYAIQDKVWTSDPDGAPWEVYAVLADSHPELEQVPVAAGASPCGVDGCC